MADVFISYSSGDQEAAKHLRARLEDDGYTCWMAPDDVYGTRTWAEQILSAIDESKVLLILVSDGANSSSHVANEVSIAFDKRKAILPVRVQDVQPTGSLEYLLKLAQWVDAFPGPVDRHMQPLRDALAALIVEAGATVPAPPEHNRRGLRGWFAGRRVSTAVVVAVGAVVLVAIVVLGFAQVLDRLNRVASPSTPASSASAPPAGSSSPGSVQTNTSAKAGELRWSLGTGGGLFHSPLIRDGAVYAGGFGQVLYVSDLKSGKERLQLPAGGGVSGIPEVADGLIFYPCDDKSLHAVDAKTGQLKWQFKTSVNVPNPPEWISGPKADAKGRLYFGVADGTLVSVDAKTGKKLWSVKLTQPGIIPQPLVVGDSIFYSSWDTKVGLVNADTGKITTTQEMASSIYGLPQFDDGRFYVRSYEGVVFALDQHTLAQVWRANVGAWNATNSGNGIDYYPVVHDGVLCCPGENSTMFAFDAATGKALWKVKAASPVFPAAIGDGVAVWGTEDGTLFAVEAKSGKRLWTYRAVGSLAEPVAEADGIVVASDTSGNIYALPVR